MLKFITEKIYRIAPLLVCSELSERQKCNTDKTAALFQKNKYVYEIMKKVGKEGGGGGG